MRRLSKTALAVLATVVTSAVAVAQSTPPTQPRPARTAQPPRADTQPGRRPGPAQFGMRRGGPAANLLRLKEQLELTDAQVKQLEALQQVAPPEPKASEMMRAQADLMDATKGDVNLEKARAAFDRMARIRTDEQVAHLKVQQDARNVLTAAQKTKYDAFTANMRGAMRVQRNMQQRGMQGDMRGMQRSVRGMQREFQRGPGGPGMGPQGMGPGMAPQGMGRGMMGPGMNPQGMGPQGPPPGAPMRRRMPPPVVPPPADSIR